MQPGWAAEDTPAREQALEKRIQVLEQRLRDLEAKLTSKPSEAGVVKRHEQRQARVPERLSTPRSAEAPATSAIPPSGIEPNAREGAPQETFVFRDNSVTLKPGQVEISTQGDYSRANGLLQTDRAFLSATSFRLGLLDWLEANATLPAFTSSRTRGVGPFRTQSKEVSGLGDLQMQINARLRDQTAEIPGAVLSVGLVAPTGGDPFDFSSFQPDPRRLAYNPNPIDRNAAYLSRGAWALLGNLQFYKTIDPLILFFGFGTRHFFPQSVAGHAIQYGETYTYNAGFSFAVSEKSTLGLQFTGAYEIPLSVDKRRVPQSELEPVALRVSLIQRIFPQTWLEPSIGAGLTADAPNLDVGLGLRHRF